MRKELHDLPAWEFDIDEVSAGVYEVRGRDRAGHRVVAKGIDLDVALEQCRREAVEIEARRPTGDQ